MPDRLTGNRAEVAYRAAQTLRELVVDNNLQVEANNYGGGQGNAEGLQGQFISVKFPEDSPLRTSPDLANKFTAALNDFVVAQGADIQGIGAFKQGITSLRPTDRAYIEVPTFGMDADTNEQLKAAIQGALDKGESGVSPEEAGRIKAKSKPDNYPEIIDELMRQNAVESRARSGALTAKADELMDVIIDDDGLPAKIKNKEDAINYARSKEMTDEQKGELGSWIKNAPAADVQQVLLRATESGNNEVAVSIIEQRGRDLSERFVEGYLRNAVASESVDIVASVLNNAKPDGKALAAARESEELFRDVGSEKLEQIRGMLESYDPKSAVPVIPAIPVERAATSPVRPSPETDTGGTEVKTEVLPVLIDRSELQMFRATGVPQDDGSIRIESSRVAAIDPNKPTLVMLPGMYLDYEDPGVNDRISSLAAGEAKRLGGLELAVDRIQFVAVAYPSVSNNPDEYKAMMINSQGPEGNRYSVISGKVADALLGDVSSNPADQPREIARLQQSLRTKVISGYSMGSYQAEGVANAMVAKLEEKGFSREVITKEIMPNLKIVAYGDLGVQTRGPQTFDTGVSELRVLNQNDTISAMMKIQLGMDVPFGDATKKTRGTTLAPVGANSEMLVLNIPDKYATSREVDLAEP